jgi:DNA-directed RNA polymerase subunit RPC12/RpoP|tara:strand:+ start:99 stop:494 length:396 start_codon:yes stop_codon:yes gene_type:complete
MDKQQLKDLLKQFSEEEIRDALGDEKKNKNRRRGKGKRKKSNNNKRPQDNFENKFDDIISTIRLSPEEAEELKEAEKSDKGAEMNPNRGKRGSAEKKSFRCAACGRDYKMFPSQVFNRERWKCNRCITGGK